MAEGIGAANLCSMTSWEAKCECN